MQEELLQFKIQKIWILVDLPYGKKAIGTKWVYKNKKDKRGVVSAFLYGKIDEEVYVSQPLEILKKFDFTSVKDYSNLIEDPEVFGKTKDEEQLVWMFQELQRPSYLNDYEVETLVTMLEKILIGNPQQEVVNFLAEDLFHNSARSRQLWLLLLQRQSMLLPPTAVGKCVDSKSMLDLWGLILMNTKEKE
ncbi:hypothetical protein Tco_0771368 [Tanacetum coccineum]|uniref:Uncharacterized protein n=1 Tax=Tanacetum coccineum TaxID=301880 RepID=A0ABQ4ZHR0_9ASTR